MHLYEVLRRPLITEKGTMLQSQGKYIFEVADEANKQMVKQAVEKAFNVSVIAVNMIKEHGKSRRMGRRIIQEPSLKKAIVTLKPGDKIQLFEGV